MAQQGAVAGIGRCRYGASAVWRVGDDLAGSAARRFAGRVGLFFRNESAPLLVDLRDAGLIDSAGADALARCHDSHEAFRVVGRPASWAELPLPVRLALRRLGPAPDLESALVSALPAPAPPASEQRRHPRIPVRIPVEVVCGGRTEVGALRDISRGGVRLADLPEGWLGDLRRSGAEMSLGLFGLDADPLGRELTAGRGDGPVCAVPVCALPGGVLGARFAEAHPPV